MGGLVGSDIKKRLLSATPLRVWTELIIRLGWVPVNERAAKPGPRPPFHSFITAFSASFHVSREAPRHPLTMFDNRPPTPWRDEPSPWRDEAVEQTQPVLALPAAPPPPPPAKPRRRKDGLALLLIGVLVGGGVGIGGARAITSQLVPAAASAPATTPTATSSDTAAVAAIKDVIQQANAAQAQAFARNDPTAMKATSTTAHYQEMVQVNRDLSNGGVTKIELLNIAFGAISLNGTSAAATTTETWRSTYADGTTGQSIDQNDYDLVLENGAWKIAANTQPNSTGATAPTQPQTPTNTTVQSTSRNWSGYAATGGTFSSVSATWIVATPDPKVAGIDATWVGIGGANTTDLIQAGTEATVNGDGTVTYDAWTETLPQSVRTVSLTVSGGDTVSVAITEQSAGSWLVEMKNVTTGKTYTTTIRYSSSKSSAEWIQEAPSVGRGIAPLDSFGTVKFSAASAVVNGRTQSLSGANAKAVTMTNGAGQPLAVPSGIGADGASFSVSRTTTPATGGGTGAPGRRRG